MERPSANKNWIQPGPRFLDEWEAAEMLSLITEVAIEDPAPFRTPQQAACGCCPAPCAINSLDRQMAALMHRTNQPETDDCQARVDLLRQQQGTAAIEANGPLQAISFKKTAQFFFAKLRR